MSAAGSIYPPNTHLHSTHKEPPTTRQYADGGSYHSTYKDTPSRLFDGTFYVSACEGGGFTVHTNHRRIVPTTWAFSNIRDLLAFLVKEALPMALVEIHYELVDKPGIAEDTAMSREELNRRLRPGAVNDTLSEAVKTAAMAAVHASAAATKRGNG
jgi:hypothetical protein